MHLNFANFEYIDWKPNYVELSQKLCTCSQRYTKSACKFLTMWKECFNTLTLWKLPGQNGKSTQSSGAWSKVPNTNCWKSTIETATHCNILMRKLFKLANFLCHFKYCKVHITMRFLYQYYNSSHYGKVSKVLLWSAKGKKKEYVWWHI